MRLFIRCIEGEVQLGPGKIRLLELVEHHGSISEAASASASPSAGPYCPTRRAPWTCPIAAPGF